MSGIPFATSPWDEVVPGLWQGGHVWRTPEGYLEDAVVGSEFDLVLSLYSRWGCGPADGVERRYAAIPDGPLTDEYRATVRRFADLAHEAVTAGRKVLVRCQAGYNRSGLVVALTLLRRGYGPDAAIDLIRRRRSTWALCNERFVEYVHEDAAVMS